MICYLDSCRDKVLKLCTQQTFTELTGSRRTAMLIDAYRSGGNPDAKSQLPAFVFMGYDPAMLEGKPGKRQKACLKPTGLVMFDFDHLKEQYGITPCEAYGRFLKIMPKLGLTPERNLALAHNTCSNNGLRAVIFLQNGKTIAQIQEQVSELLGIECDKAVKDLSRLSFCPKAEDILYINKSLLFGTIESKGASLQAADGGGAADDPRTSYGVNKKGRAFGTQSADSEHDHDCLGRHSTDDTDTQQASDTHQTSDTQQTTEQQSCPEGTELFIRSASPLCSSKNPVQPSCPEGTELLINPVQAQRSAGIEDTPSSDAARRDAPSRFPAEYHGVPYASIVEKWIELRGGKPEPGDRHATLVELAMDLRKICDNDKEWIASLMPDFDKGEQEKRDCIEWAVGRQHSKISGTLYDALAALGVERNTEGQNYRNAEGRKDRNLRVSESNQAGLYCRTGADATMSNTESSDATAVSSLSEQSEEAMPPALPDELPSLVRLMTSKVLDHQKAAVASMMFPALATHVNNCLFKLRDNTDVELSLMCCLFAPQSVGKGCVKPPLRLIMKDIKAQDKVNRQRERQWQEEQKNKKANEKGKSRPDDIVIRILSSDTTPAAFLGRLMAAENGDGENPNLCTYSQVDEIEDLYRFCASGGKNVVQQMIKRTWDRDDIGAERWSANSANISTVLRWNWAASSTIEGGKKFFKNCLTDGTTSRVDFCTIIPPGKVIDFCYGDYDDEFEDALRPYIDNLRQFSCAKTEEGRVVPCSFPEVRALEDKMNRYINDTSSTMPDNTWENYAWRAKVMAIKKLIVLYIANGCTWEDTFEDFVWWSFRYSMWCKMNLFYDAASAAFKDEQLHGTNGQRTPLKEMTRTFTLAQFAQKCQEYKVKSTPKEILRKFKTRGIIAQNGNLFTINPEWAEKNGIREA